MQPQQIRPFAMVPLRHHLPLPSACTCIRVVIFGAPQPTLLALPAMQVNLSSQHYPNLLHPEGNAGAVVPSKSSNHSICTGSVAAGGTLKAGCQHSLALHCLHVGQSGHLAGRYASRGANHIPAYMLDTNCMHIC